MVQMVMILPCRYKENALICRRFPPCLALAQRTTREALVATTIAATGTFFTEP
jgi:hypothetical protein